jgi:hypothetical protein
VLKGTFTIVGGDRSVEATIERYEAAPNKRYFVMNFGDQGKIEGGTDGEIHWMTQPGVGTKVDEGEEKAISARRAIFNGQLHWREQYPTVECVAKEDVDGEACYKVVLTPEVGPAVTMYYSTKTGLPIKSETTSKTDEDTALTIADKLEDYRTVDGIKLPFKITRTVRAGAEDTPARTYITTWTSIAHNTNIPASKFEVSFVVKAQAEKAKKQAEAKKAQEKESEKENQ